MFKKLSARIAANDYYKIWLKDAWPYVTGAILLSIFQIATLAVTGNPWGVSGAFANWGAWLWELVGGSVDRLYYFSSAGAQRVLEGGFLRDPGSLRNVALIFGAFFAALAASGFKIKKIKSGKQIVAAILGGTLMGFGARIGFGCNIGAFYSGISSLSLSGWVFGVFLFVGAIIGSRMLVKWFM